VPPVVAVRYLLVVVTHGLSPHLAAALEAFRNHVVPHPVCGLLWVDGPDVDDAAFNAVAGHGIHDWTFAGPSEQHGFCATYTDAWQAAVDAADRHECDHVFWLESDFILNRLVDVSALAYLLAQNPDLAQVALMRGAANEQEHAAGGVYESRPDGYSPHAVTVPQDPVVHGARIRAYPWLLQRAYFTTNPNLMTVDFMRAHPWPSYPSECEGLFSWDLIADGLSFAVWGDGKPWVDHVGVRTGKGY
jgi:hypothetical protein